MSEEIDWKVEAERLHDLIYSPEILDFIAGVQKEAAYQRERWDSEHDAGKTLADWFWLIGYLAEKALHAQFIGDVEKSFASYYF